MVTKYVDAFNRGDLNGLRSLFAEDAEIQGVLGKGLMDKVLPIWQQLIEGYGMQLTVEDLCAEGDVVAVRYTERGPSARASIRKGTDRQVVRARGHGVVRDPRRQDPAPMGRPRCGVAGEAVGDCDWVSSGQTYSHS